MDDHPNGADSSRGFFYSCREPRLGCRCRKKWSKKIGIEVFVITLAGSSPSAEGVYLRTGRYQEPESRGARHGRQ